MVRSRSLRRFVAVAAAVVFLACQSANVVYARPASIPQSDRVTLQGSCHDPERQSDTTYRMNDCQANCQSQVTASMPSSAAVFAATDLPAVANRADRIVVFADLMLPAEALLLRVEAPPLAILHCCLRN
ncbi:MAG TPA: hypothetical protein VLB72_09905 [Burkholderiales bacterium]|nr:hypothetical protein [Burkholderiales bacterium]